MRFSADIIKDDISKDDKYNISIVIENNADLVISGQCEMIIYATEDINVGSFVEYTKGGVKTATSNNYFGIATENASAGELVRVRVKGD